MSLTREKKIYQKTISCIFAESFLLIFWCLKYLGFNDRASGIASPGGTALPGTAAGAVSELNPCLPQPLCLPLQISWSFVVPLVILVTISLITVLLLLWLSHPQLPVSVQFYCCWLSASPGVTHAAANPGSGLCHLVPVLANLLSN